MESGKFKCFVPSNHAGNHGSDPNKSLKIAPLTSEYPITWVGYRNDLSKQFRGLHPSFQDVLKQAESNYRNREFTSFPRFDQYLKEKQWYHDSAAGGTYRKRVCCAGCKEKRTRCEPLFIEWIDFELQCGKKLYLPCYAFYLRGEEMIALVHSSGDGIYYFQRRDGTLTTTNALVSDHCSQYFPKADGEEYGSSSSGLTSLCSSSPPLAAQRPKLAAPPPPLSLDRRPEVVASSLPSFNERPIPNSPKPSQTQTRKRKAVVVDLSFEQEDEDEDQEQEQEQDPEQDQEPEQETQPPIPEIKREQSDQETTTTTTTTITNPQRPIPSSSPTPITTLPNPPPHPPPFPSSSSTSFSSRYAPDSLAEEYGRITTQVFKRYSMRVFEHREVVRLVGVMERAVRDDDRVGLSRAYGALRAFLLLVD